MPIFWKLPGLGISNMNFLIADVIWLVSCTNDNFLTKGAAKITSKQFSEFGSTTIIAILNNEKPLSAGKKTNAMYKQKNIIIHHSIAEKCFDIGVF